MTKNLNDLTIVALTNGVNALRDMQGVSHLKKAQSKAKAVDEINERAKALHYNVGTNGKTVTLDSKPEPQSRTKHRSDDVVIVLRSDKPKKGSKRNPYQFYATGMTVAECVKAGVKQRDVNYDANVDRKGGAVLTILPSDSQDAKTARSDYLATAEAA